MTNCFGKIPVMKKAVRQKTKLENGKTLVYKIQKKRKTAEAGPQNLLQQQADSLWQDGVAWALFYSCTFAKTRKITNFFASEVKNVQFFEFPNTSVDLIVSLAEDGIPRKVTCEMLESLNAVLAI